jgi:hypothetical protein
MNPSVIAILSTIGIGAFKNIYKGSMDKIDPRLIGIVEKITSCVGITDDSTAAVFLEFLLSIENSPMYDAFLGNLEQMVVSDFNVYYVEMTKTQFFDCIGEYFNQFEYWYNLPFVNLKTADMQGISLSRLTKKTAATNPILVFRDFIRKAGYHYLPAYYALKEYNETPEHLKPYQILFAKAYISMSGKAGIQSGNFSKFRVREIGTFDIQPAMQNYDPNNIASRLRPKFKNQFDDNFERIASSIQQKAMSKDNSISKLMATDYSGVLLPNFMPPKEMIILFWSYTGILSVKSNVTGLWR